MPSLASTQLNFNFEAETQILQFKTSKTSIEEFKYQAQSQLKFNSSSASTQTIELGTTQPKLVMILFSEFKEVLVVLVVSVKISNWDDEI